MIAHKFGGSSVATAERIAGVVDILLSRSERQVVVISAMQGVTDALIAEANNRGGLDNITAIVVQVDALDGPANG